MVSSPQLSSGNRYSREYDEDLVLYFDGYDVEMIYEVRRLPTQNGSKGRERARADRRSALKEELRSDLESLAGEDVAYDQLTGRQRRLYLLWGRSQDPHVYAQAAENLRSQSGRAVSFGKGVARSGRYIEDFKRIFREEGVPEELAYLPHVESSFIWNARSGVGAVGMWQFMKSTGKRFLLIDPGVDERLDPYSAARAAAAYLQELKDELGSWPLALTAYNQGPSRLSDAVRQLGTTDITVIVQNYRGAGFGFMGRNFYAEFLAAMDLSDALKEEPRELPEPLDIRRDYETYQLPAYTQVKSLSKYFNVSKETLLDLNLGLTKESRSRDEYLPKGYDLKLPKGAVSAPDEVFASIPSKLRPPKRPKKTYKVRSGDSLSGIAAKFKTSVRSLMNLNGIKNPNRLRAGQVIKLPH